MLKPTKLANIDARECRKREIISLLAFIATVFVFLALKVYDVGRLWYVLLFATSFAAVLGLLQAREKT